MAFSAKDYGGDVQENICPTLRAGNSDASHANSGNWMGVCYPLDLRNAGRDPEKHDEQNRQGVGTGDDGEPSPTLSQAFVPGVAVAFEPRYYTRGQGGAKGDEIIGALNAQFYGSSDKAPHDMRGLQVRRLMPSEYDVLQGFKKDYTLIPVGNKMAADGPRYKALGNSKAVPVVQWLGRRIEKVHALKISAGSE
jgi:DNA (cytosine-5)-methyltransferase 1